MKYIKSAATVLNRDCVSRRGLDLSKELLWVSVDYRAGKLQAVNIGEMKKKSAEWPESNHTNAAPGSSPGQLDHFQSLNDRNFAAL